MNKKYDCLIVGSGLFGATFAHQATRQGKKCLVIDKRPHLGGNVYCDNIEGINVHKYGAHIFHTSNKEVWDYVNSIVPFNRYTNSPVANYHGMLYNLPFNMNTFYQMWGVHTPEEAQAKIAEQFGRSCLLNYIQNDQNNPKANLYLALYLLDKGDKNQAKEAIRRGLNAQGTNEIVTSKLLNLAENL